MTYQHTAFTTLVFTILMFASGPCAAAACQAGLWLDYPCEITAMTMPGLMTTQTETLVAYNVTATPLQVAFFPSIDACITASTDWITFSDYEFYVPPMIQSTLSIDITFDATSLGPGVYRKQACLTRGSPGAEYITIPITLDVGDVLIFANGFDY